MCDLAAALTIGMSAANSIAGHQQQRAGAKAAGTAQREQAENMRRATALEYSNRLVELGRGRAEASLRIQKESRDELRAREKARVSSGESGFSFAALERDLTRADAREAVRAKHAADSRETQLALEQLEQGLRSRLDGLGPIKRASALDLGLDIAGSAFGELDRRLPKRALDLG